MICGFRRTNAWDAARSESPSVNQIAQNPDGLPYPRALRAAHAGNSAGDNLFDFRKGTFKKTKLRVAPPGRQPGGPYPGSPPPLAGGRAPDPGLTTDGKRARYRATLPPTRIGGLS